MTGTGGAGGATGGGMGHGGPRESRLRLKSATADGSRISLSTGGTGGGGSHVSSLVRLALSSSNFPEVLADLLGSMPLVSEVRNDFVN